MTLEHFAIFILMFMIVILLSYIISAITVRAFKSEHGLRVFITPGVAVHEFSHAIACILTGAKVSEINLFAKNGGYVMHSEPRLKLIGPPIISIAPVIGCTLFLWAIRWLFSMYIYVPPLNGQDAVTLFIISFFGFFDMLWQNFSTGLVPAVLMIIYLYLTFSVSSALAPSAQDFKNSAAFIFILGFIAVFIILYPPIPFIVPNYSGPATPILDAVINVLFTIVSTALILEIFALVFIAIIFIPIICLRR